MNPASPPQSEIPTAPSSAEVDAQWRQREGYWKVKLGRIRLGVEPIQDQLTRMRKVTWSLTAVPGMVGAIVLCIFAAFSRIDIGLMIVGILLLPIVVGAWFDYWNLRRLTLLYQAERSLFRKERDKARGLTASTEGRPKS